MIGWGLKRPYGSGGHGSAQAASITMLSLMGCMLVAGQDIRGPGAWAQALWCLSGAQPLRLRPRGKMLPKWLKALRMSKHESWQSSGSNDGPQWAQWLPHTWNGAHGGKCGVCQGCKWHRWKATARGGTLHQCSHPDAVDWDGQPWQSRAVLIPACCPYQVSRAFDFGKGPPQGAQLALLIWPGPAG